MAKSRLTIFSFFSCRPSRSPGLVPAPAPAPVPAPLVPVGAVGAVGGAAAVDAVGGCLLSLLTMNRSVMRTYVRRDWWWVGDGSGNRCGHRIEEMGAEEERSHLPKASARCVFKCACD